MVSLVQAEADVVEEYRTHPLDEVVRDDGVRMLGALPPGNTRLPSVSRRASRR